MSDDSALAAFWQQRNRRERWIIGLGLPLVLLALLYVYIWMPVNKDRQRLRVQIPQLQAANQTLQAQAREVMMLKAGTPARPAGAASVDPVTAIRQSIAKMKLGEAQVQSDGTGQIRVSFTNVSFDNLARWLDTLQTQQGLRPLSARIKAVPAQSGQVTAQLSFRGGAQS